MIGWFKSGGFERAIRFSIRREPILSGDPGEISSLRSGWPHHHALRFSGCDLRRLGSTSIADPTIRAWCNHMITCHTLDGHSHRINCT